MSFRSSRLYMAAVCYLSLPVFVFFFCWLRLGAGVLAGLAFLAGLFFLMRSIWRYFAEEVFAFRREHVAAFIVVFIWLLSTAHGDFIGTVGVDIPYRDAMYHDLIAYPWPLIYEYEGMGYAFVYYHAFWLVPAGVSYLLGLGWTGSHVVLFAWTYLGLCLAVLMLCELLQARRRGHVLFVCLLFLFWSAPCLLGMIVKSVFAQTALYIPDTPGVYAWQFAGGMDHGYRLDYASRTTYDGIENTYNQYVAMFLVSAMFLRFRFQWHLMAAVSLLLLPFSPFGFVGLALLAAGWLVAGGAAGVRGLFRREVVFLALVLCPIYGSYYLSNSMVDDGAAGSIFYVPLAAYGVVRVGTLLLYLALYFALYLYLVRWDFLGGARFRYWWILGVAAVLPIFRVGKMGDLLWGGSGPVFFVVMVLVMRQVLAAWERRRFWGRDLLLAVVLGVAVLTPCMQMVATFRGCVLARQVMVYPDPEQVQGSFVGHAPEEIGNFLARGYEDAIFYRYLAKAGV